MTNMAVAQHVFYHAGCCQAFLSEDRCRRFSKRFPSSSVPLYAAKNAYSETLNLWCTSRKRSQILVDCENVGNSVSRSEVDKDGGGKRRGRVIVTEKEKANALKDSSSYPIMRVYRNNLCTLEVTGDAKPWQVLGAMAADGGITAADELAQGKLLMTVETIIPGRAQDNSTVSTKLIAPTNAVNENANALRKRRSTKRLRVSSGNALARAFQTVVMQQLFRFELRIHAPGSVRDMGNLANEIEDNVVASIDSSEQTVLETLAQSVCDFALWDIKSQRQPKAGETGILDRVLHFGREPQQAWYSDKAISISPLSEAEAREGTKEVFYDSSKSRLRGPPVTGRSLQAWWPLPASSLSQRLIPEQLKGRGNMLEHIPSYKLKIDTKRLRIGVNGQASAAQVVEINLTHMQLVDIADVLDLFFEDPHTVPVKCLHSRIELDVPGFARNKVSAAILTAAQLFLVGGALLVGLLVGIKLQKNSLGSRMDFLSTESSSRTTFVEKWCQTQRNPEPLLPVNEKVPESEMELLCSWVVGTVKDAFSLPEEVQSSPERGAWLGKDLTLWGRVNQLGDVKKLDRGLVRVEPTDYVSEQSRLKVSESEAIPSGSVQDTTGNKKVLLYQIVLSRDGKVMGFQPGNKAAIQHWAEYPFAQVLHNGHKLRPGLYEAGLKYRRLQVEVVAIELLFLDDTMAQSVSARPFHI